MTETIFRERLQAIIDWADLAIKNREEFDSHGVRNLDGPVFDAARDALQGIPPVVDVAGGEPAAWLHPTAGWAHANYHQVRLHCFNDGPMPVPLYRAAATEADHAD